MKKGAMLGLMVLMISATACKKEVSGTPAGEVLGKGVWTVSYFWDKDHDETGHFSGYEFTFDNGTVTANNGTNTISGTYSDQGSDDSTPKLIITFPEVEPFDELSDDWHVIEKTNDVIKLEEQSGSGGTEYLNFSRK